MDKNYNIRGISPSIFLLLGSLCVIICSSCFNYGRNFIMNDINVPMVGEKGQFNADVTINPGLAFNTSYGIDSNWLIMANGRIGGEVENEFSYNLGGGYYRTGEEGGLEVLAGFGGGSTNSFGGSGSFGFGNNFFRELSDANDNRFTKYFLQSDFFLGDKTKVRRFAFTIRASYFHANNWNYTYENSNGIQTSVATTASDFFLAGMITMRKKNIMGFGFHWLLQVGIEGPIMHAEHYWLSPSFVRIGLGRSIWSKKKGK